MSSKTKKHRHLNLPDRVKLVACSEVNIRLAIDRSALQQSKICLEDLGKFFCFGC
jgi:YbbR domain-containing protein